MYKLKEGIKWDNVKEVYKDTGKFVFEDDFEKVDLPVVELKEEFNKKEYIIKKDGRSWLIIRYFNNSESFSVWIGELCNIKSIEDFNNRAAMLFGFYLK